MTVSNTGTAALSWWRVEFDRPAGATIGSFHHVAIAFDDVQNQESLVHDADPRRPGRH
jgi:hypothetical protein